MKILMFGCAPAAVLFIYAQIIIQPEALPLGLVMYFEGLTGSGPCEPIKQYRSYPRSPDFGSRCGGDAGEIARKSDPREPHHRRPEADNQQLPLPVKHIDGRQIYSLRSQQSYKCCRDFIGMYVGFQFWQPV